MGRRLEKRFGRKGAPVLLWAYAALAVGESAVRTILVGPSALFLGLLIAVGIALVWLLLRGGRAVWCFAVLSEVLQVVGLAWGTPAWSAGLSLLALALLCAPASRAYVWREARLRRQQVKPADEEALGLGARLSSGVLWEEMWERINAKAVNWAIVGWLALFWVLTLVLVGGLRSVRAHSDHGTPVLDVLGWTVEILHLLAFLAILCLLVAIAIRALARRVQSGT